MGAFLRRSGAAALAPLLVVAAGIAAYANTFSGPLVFDDIPAVAENPSIHHLGTAWFPPAGGETVSGRPVLNFSLALNYALDGDAVRGYHAANLLIHLLAGVTLLGIVRRTTRSTGIAVVAALLWTVHPLQTEAVTYVVQRAESLMGLFYLLTLYAFIRGSASSRPGGWWIVSVLSCLAGMGTKEVMVSAPVLVLLYDRTFVAGTFAGAWRQRRVYYGALAATWSLLAYLLLSTGGNRGSTAGFGLGISWWSYALTQFPAIVHYLRLAFWPHPLVFEYGTFWIGQPWTVLPEAGLVATLVAATVYGLCRRPIWGFLGTWFFALLAPTSLVPGTMQMMVEHRMYLPLAAVVTAVVGTAAAAAQRWGGSALRVAAGCAGLALVAAAAGLTFARNQDYRSALALWGDTAAKRPNNSRAHWCLGTALFDAGRLPEAAAECELALRLDPGNPDAEYNLANVFAQTGRVPEALTLYRRALARHPFDAAASCNYGNALFLAGQSGAALAQYQESLRLNPDSPKTHNDLGFTLAQSGRLPEAVAEYRAALRLNPASAEVCYNLASALGQMERWPDAIASYRAALQLRPTYAEGHNNLANALARCGQPGAALAEYERALTLRPDYWQGHFNYGTALWQLGRLAAAREEFETVLRLRPDCTAARDNLKRLPAAAN